MHDKEMFDNYTIYYTKWIKFHDILTATAKTWVTINPEERICLTYSLSIQ